MPRSGVNPASRGSGWVVVAGKVGIRLSSITGVLQPLYRDHKRKNSVTELGSVTVYFPSNYYFVESTPPSREGVQGDPVLS